ncbi:hypothetical protein MKZ26_06760 [Sporosarcina sp. FSL K6-6792]|uniref:hypothetical protein n=1 Tax=Sporosarcina sp. FSL K6-6792 TaxID=2921559 RepID=UPI0030F9C28F
MKITINSLSFILSLLCIPLFFIALSSADFFSFTTKIIGLYPLDIVLSITVIIFFLGVIGLKDVREWKAMARGIFTIIFMSIFSIVLTFIIFIGRMLG